MTEAAATGPLISARTGLLLPPLPREHLLPPPLLIGAGRHCLEEQGRNTSGKEQGRPPTCSSGKEKGRPSMAQHAGRKGRAAIRRPTAAATTERVCLYPTRRRRTHATVGLYPTLEKMEKNRWNSIPERRRRRRSLFSMAMARRSGRAGRSPREKKTREGGGSGVRKAAYFYAQGRSIWQLLEDGELGWETIGDYFFLFSPKDQRWGREIKNYWRCS